MAIGSPVNGERDILGLWPGDGSEGAKFWLQIDHRAEEPRRGRWCIAVCDGLNGPPEAIDTVWELTTVQACIPPHPQRVPLRLLEALGPDRPAICGRSIPPQPSPSHGLDSASSTTMGPTLPGHRQAEAERLGRVRTVPGLRRRDPQDHLLDQCD